MNAKKAIETIKVLLGMETPVETVEVSLAEVELVDGTLLKVEGELEVGKSIMVVSEEGESPAPEGIHETTDGKLIKVNSEGVIESIEEKAEESAPETEMNFSDEMIGAITELIRPLNEKIQRMEEQYGKLNTEFTSFKNEPVGEKVTNNYSSKKETKDARLEMLASLRNKK